MINIEQNVRTYLGDRSPVERASSFDYCFNYFRDFRDRDATAEIAAPPNLDLSCLHLGYCLASWGMLRGSTLLHTKSYRFFDTVIGAIAEEPNISWDLDVDGYSDDGITALINTRGRLAHALTASAIDGRTRAPTDTLLTKVMLRVFGSVPAFDTFFLRGFRSMTGTRGTFGRRSLQAVGTLYSTHADAIEEHRVQTIDGRSGQPTNRRYTRAKVIDMVLLIEGGGS